MHFYSAVKLNYVITSPVLFYEEKRNITFKIFAINL